MNSEHTVAAFATVGEWLLPAENSRARQPFESIPEQASPAQRKGQPGEIKKASGNARTISGPMNAKTGHIVWAGGLAVRWSQGETC